MTTHKVKRSTIFGVSSVDLTLNPTQWNWSGLSPDSDMLVFFTSIIFRCRLRRLRAVIPPPTHNHIYHHPSTLISPLQPPTYATRSCLPFPSPSSPILHSCQAATCSLQHAAQLLCYNNKLRSTMAGRSHYLQLLLYQQPRSHQQPTLCRGGTGCPPFFV